MSYFDSRGGEHPDLASREAANAKYEIASALSESNRRLRDQDSQAKGAEAQRMIQSWFENAKAERAEADHIKAQREHEATIHAQEKDRLQVERESLDIKRRQLEIEEAESRYRLELEFLSNADSDDEKFNFLLERYDEEIYSLVADDYCGRTTRFPELTAKVATAADAEVKAQQSADTVAQLKTQLDDISKPDFLRGWRSMAGIALWIFGGVCVGHLLSDGLFFIWMIVLALYVFAAIVGTIRVKTAIRSTRAKLAHVETNAKTDAQIAVSARKAASAAITELIELHNSECPAVLATSVRDAVVKVQNKFPKRVRVNFDHLPNPNLIDAGTSFLLRLKPPRLC